MTRPGPSSIAPLACPGGVVFHVYGVPSCVLLIERRSANYADAAGHALVDAEFVDTLRAYTGDDAVCVVAYDGDTGERMDLRDILGTDRL